MNTFYLDNKFKKIIAIIAFVSIISICIIISLTSPATGYEISLYNAYGWYFWLLFVLSAGSGALMFISQVYLDKKSKFWISTAFLIIVVSNIILLALPLIRSYELFPLGDSIYHIATAIDIANTGHINTNDIYPFIHIFEFFFLTLGLNKVQLVVLTSIVGYLTYVFSIYILGGALSKNKNNKAIFVTLFALIPIFSYSQVSIQPFLFGIYFMPLLFYFYFKGKNDISGKMEMRLLFIVLIISITFVHPVTTLYLIILLFVAILFERIYEKIGKNELKLKSFSLGLPLISFAIFFFWYFSFVGIQRNFIAVINSLFYTSTRKSVLESQVGTLSQANINIFETLRIFLFQYGSVVILFMITAILLMIFLKYRNQIKDYDKRIIYIFTFLTTVAFLIVGLSFVKYTILNEPYRIFAILIFTSTILFGVLAFEIFKKFKNKTIFGKYNLGLLFIGIIIITFMLSNTISMLNIYGSTLSTNVNLEVSSMEFKGGNWIIDHSKVNGLVSETYNTFGLINIFRVNREESERYSELGLNSSSVNFDRKRVPSHFGYDKYDSLAGVYNHTSRYLTVTKEGLINNNLLPHSVRSKGYQYNVDDLNKLENDKSVIEIYDNGEYNVWYL